MAAGDGNVLRLERCTRLVAAPDQQVALFRPCRRLIVLAQAKARACDTDEECPAADVEPRYQGISRFVCLRPTSAARSLAAPIITPSVIMSTTLSALTELRKKILLALVALNTR